MKSKYGHNLIACLLLNTKIWFKILCTAATAYFCSIWHDPNFSRNILMDTHYTHSVLSYFLGMLLNDCFVVLTEECAVFLFTHTHSYAYRSFLFWALMNCRSLMKICWMGNYRNFFSHPLIHARARTNMFFWLYTPLFSSHDVIIVDRKSCSGKIYWHFWSITEIKFIAVQFHMIYWYLFAFYVFCVCVFALCNTKNYLCSCTYMYINNENSIHHYSIWCYFLLKYSLNSFILLTLKRF